jgi:hypothetical protein
MNAVTNCRSRPWPLRPLLVAAVLLAGVAAIRADAPPATAQALSRPTLTAVTPREVEEEKAPVTLTLRGERFAPGALVRLVHISEDLLEMDLRPARVTSGEIAVAVGADWFQALRRTPPPTTLKPAANVLPDHFLVKVINPGGQVSGPAGVRIRREALRIGSLSPQSLRLVSDRSTEITVTIERRTWQGDVALQVRAFEKPDIRRDLRGPQHGVAKQVPGIRGTATIKAGQSSARVAVQVPADVKPGAYTIDVTATPIGAGGNCDPPACGYAHSSSPGNIESWCHPNCPPALPDSFHFTGTTTTTISMSWHDQSDIEQGFQVERRPPAGTWAVVASLGPDTQPNGYPLHWNTYTDTGLIPGTTYCYRVKAWNANGGAYSADGCATTGVPPCAPTDLNIQAASASSSGTAEVSLRWKDSPSNDPYCAWAYVERATSANGPWTASGTTPAVPNGNYPDSTGYTVQNLPQGTYYCFRVRFTNQTQDFFSAPSNNVCQTTYTYSGGGGGGGNPPPPPDLATVGAIWTSVGAFPEADQPFEIYQEVCNIGGTASGSFVNAYEVDYPSGPPEVLSATVGSLAPGSCWQAILYVTEGFPEGQYGIYYCADTGLSVAESNETNNCSYHGFWVGF